METTEGGKHTSARSFHCPNCKAEMTFDPAAQQMSCQYCGATAAIATEEGQRSIVEHDLQQGLGSGAATGLGAAVRTTRCQDCGATVSFPEQMTATDCDFCGSSQVLEQEQNRNLLRPESVVPFAVDQKQATSSFHRWLKGLWFRPSDLKALARVKEISGVYVPYWTFDAQVDSDWTAEAGYYYYETEEYTEQDNEGDEVTRTREVRQVRWEPAWGSRSDLYDDLLVCASRGLPEDLARKLKSFNTGQLSPYDPAFLSGWKAEEYSVDLNEAWGRALRRMEDSQHGRCGGDVPGDTQRFLSVTNRFSGETFKHVLLPIWISAYRYGDKVFRFLVNGQTGEVVGKAPWSVVKIVLFVLGLAASAVLIYFLITWLRG